MNVVLSAYSDGFVMVALVRIYCYDHDHKYNDQ